MLNIGNRLPGGSWTLKICPGPLEEKRIRFSAGDVPCVDVLLIYDRIIVSLQLDFNPKPLTLMAEITDPNDEIVLSYAPHEIILFVNGEVRDEEWPAGKIAPCECVLCEMEAELKEGATPRPVQPNVVSSFTGIWDWKPKGYNSFAGDCMPYVDGDTFHLFYLRDRRGHHSKWILGAHQWAHISSKDLVHWDEHPDAICIEDENEGSICTGSVIKFGNIYRAFFCIRMTDKSPAKVMWADSEDLIHFTRSKDSFLLKPPYEPVSARDPFAYYDEDEGLYHLLITTSIKRDDGFHGIISDFVSKDLTNWEDRTPLVEFESTTRNQPACPDFFEKDGLWYLSYRDPERVNRYFFSENKRGPWIAPEDNFVLSREYIVPKSAKFNGRIIFAAFKKDCAERYYGGTLCLFEAVPDGNGSLKFEKL